MISHFYFYTPVRNSTLCLRNRTIPSTKTYHGIQHHECMCV
ncbi:hypothetical protein RSAG8_00254, partial [Rhizoctonia solani AG-8 WAC10335]